MLIILKDAFLGLGMYGPGPALGKMKVGGGKLGQVVEKNGRAVINKYQVFQRVLFNNYSQVIFMAWFVYLNSAVYD